MDSRVGQFLSRKKGGLVMRIPRELDSWTVDETINNFDSLLTLETSDLLFCLDEDIRKGVGLAGTMGVIWWVLNPAQQSEIISAYENFDPTNYRFEVDHQ